MPGPLLDDSETVAARIAEADEVIAPRYRRRLRPLPNW